ncbi:MAG: IS200/IS605 family transposase [Bacteroidota bacterium]
MQHYRRTSHSLYDIKYHLVWITKYRKPALHGEVAQRVRELIRRECQKLDVEIIKGHVAKDHVHLLVSVPPKVSVSKLMQHLKGKTSYKLQHEYRRLRREFWGRHLWARGYFCATTGNVTDEAVAAYIEQQQSSDRDGDFTVETE